MRKKKKNMEGGRGLKFHRQNNLVTAHQDKHPKGVEYVVAQKMSEMKKKNHPPLIDHQN
jgi:hypothetical protein